MIINIRGTGGSGKTTVATRVMERYGSDFEIEREVVGQKRKRVVAHAFTKGGEHVELVVLGKYTTATGGCDTLPNLDLVYGLIREFREKWPRASILYEGIMASEEVNRAVALWKEARSEFVVIQLTTPIEVCLASIHARRDARGDDRPLNPKNTTERLKRVTSACERLKYAGVNVERLDREEALTRCLFHLGFVL